MTEEARPSPDQARDRRRGLLALLLLALVIFLALLLCGQVAMEAPFPAPAQPVESGSRLRADYGPWTFQPVAQLLPAIVDEALSDLGLGGLPFVSSDDCLLPGQVCPTRTASATPTAGLSPTPTPTSTRTTTATTGPTLTPSRTATTAGTRTSTSTPTATSTPTPILYPVKLANPRNVEPNVVTTVNFTILVINYGSIPPALLQQVTDCLPAQMSYVSANPSPSSTSGTCGSGQQQIVWNVNQMIAQGSFYRIRLTANAVDPSAGDILTNEVQTLDGAFHVEVNWARVYAWTPTPTAVDVTPTAVPDSATTNEDVPVTIDVLANDPPGSLLNPPLTVSIASPPSNGGAVVNVGNTITYTPNLNWSGVDNFTYQITDVDGDVSNAAAVDVTVNAVNDPPVAVNDAYSLQEDDPSLSLVAPGVLANDSDVEADPLTAVLATGPIHASAFALNADGSFAYTPVADYRGPDSFTYRASDGAALSNMATVNLTVTPVNDVPVAVDDDDAIGGPDTTTDEDVAILIDVLANDTGLGDTPIVLTIFSAPSNGTAVVVGNQIRYTPNADYRGDDSFVYQIRDTAFGPPEVQETDTATVSVHVTPVNDVPVANNDNATVAEDGTVLISVLANDAGLGDTPISITVLSGPSNGTAVVVGNQILYTPDANYCNAGAGCPTPGPADSFVYQVSDTGLPPEPPTESDSATVSLTVTSVNDPPVAVDDSTASCPGVDVLGDYCVDEDGSDVLDVLANDTDIDSPPGGWSIQSVTDPPNGTAVVVMAGTRVQYTPDPDYYNADPFGSFLTPPDTFSYTMSDGQGGTDTALVSMTVVSQNDIPSSVDDARTTNEDTPLVIAVLANDVLGNNPLIGDQPVVVTIVAAPGNGSAIVNPGNTVAYSPSPNWYSPDMDGNGVPDPDVFTYRVTDANGDFDEADVYVTVLPVNDPPVAVDDSTQPCPGVDVPGDYCIPEDTNLIVALPNSLLVNDTDVEGDPLTVGAWTLPANGVFISVPDIYADGTFIYQPNTDYFGTDTFTYWAWDGGALSTTPATVTITIIPTNDQPAANDDSATTDEDTPVTVAVLANDAGLGDTPITVTIEAPPTNGLAVVDPGNTVTYTPSANYNGPDSFEYRVSDTDNQFDVGLVTIDVTPVNDLPVANNDATEPCPGVDVAGDYCIPEDSTLSMAAPGVLVNDTDVESPPPPLTAVLVAGPSRAAAFSLNANGSFSYTPIADYAGPDSFTYQVSDGTGLSNVATVTIRIEAVNDIPVAVDDSANTTEETPVIIVVLANDSGLGDTPITVTVSPACGFCTAPSDGTVTVDGLNQITYDPDPDFFGTDTFTYRVRDADGDFDEGTVQVTVAGVNDPPYANDDAYSTTEDTPLSISAALGVLDNDWDPDGDPMVPVLVGGPANGSLTLNPNGSFLYTPSANFQGIDTFTYQARDPSLALSNVATVSITVDNVNDLPDAIDDADITDEDNDVTIDVTANDTGLGDVPVTVDIQGGACPTCILPTHGTIQVWGLNINYEPDPDWFGMDTFTYQVHDINLEADIATVTVTVNPTNDDPVAVNDNAATNEDTLVSIDVLANDTDLDSPASGWSLVSVTDPANGTAAINDNGTPGNPADDFIDYVPDTDYCNAGAGCPTPGPADSFSYTMDDGDGGSDAATVRVTVSATNDTPSAAPDSGTTDEDTPVAIDVLANDTGLGDTPLTLFVVAPGPSNGTATVNTNGTPDGADDWIDYSPDPNYNGPDSFLYRVVDVDTEWSGAGVSVTVNAVNDAPVAAADLYTLSEDAPPTGKVSVAAPGVLGNDSDVEAPPQVLTADLVATTTNGVLVFNADGSFDYTPNPDFNGADTFRYRAFDGTAYSVPVVVTLNLVSVSDLPRAVDDAASTNEDASVDIDVLANDTLGNDPAVGDQPVVLTIASPAANGTATVLGGWIRYTPDPDFNGPDAFDYRVTDADGDSDTATVVVAVSSVDDLPDAVDDSGTTAEDNLIAISVLANDTGLGDGLTSTTIPTGPANGSAVWVGNQIQYTPNLNWSGSDSFMYRIEDADGDFDAATVNVTVTPVNDDPVALDDVASTNEDTSVDISVLANDGDVDGPGPLTVLNASDPPHGTTVVIGGGTAVRYTSDPDWFGTDSLSYTLGDGGSGTDVATVSVTVVSMDDTPVANGDLASTTEDNSVLIAVLSNDTGLGDGGISVLPSSPSVPGASVVVVGTDIRYTPAPDYNGADFFTYRVQDGDGDISLPASVDVTITPVNDDPVAVADVASTNEDTSIDIDVLANDTDVDGPGPFSVIAVTDPPNGTASIIGGGSAVRYTPDPNYNGGDSFSYTLNDGGGGTDSGTLDVSVAPVNDAPVAADDSYSTNEDTTLNVSAPGVLGNDSDVDFDSLASELVSDVSNGTLALNSDGSFSYTPSLDFYGTDTFTYRAFDGAAYSNTATVTITVNEVPPEIVIDKASAQTSVLVGDTIRFIIAWANLGPGTATGVVIDDSLSGPCSLVSPSPSFPYVIGSVAEGDGGFIEVYASADAVGTCSNTATLHSDRWDPPSSSFDVDIIPSGSTSWWFAGVALVLTLGKHAQRAARRLVHRQRRTGKDS